MGADRNEYVVLAWENEQTPLSAQNLNHIESGVRLVTDLSKENANRLDEVAVSVGAFSASHDPLTETLTLSIGNIETPEYKKIINIRLDTHTSEVTTLLQNISDIQSGSITSNKAERDADNNVITTTYETKVDAVAKLNTAKSYTDSELSEEHEAREFAEQGLRDYIDSEISDLNTELSEDIATEASTARVAESGLSSRISSEISRAEAEEQRISSALSSEISTARSAESVLQQNINIESSARQSADSTLQSNIDAEISDRTTADNHLNEIKINYTDIVDNLTSTNSGLPLSAKQGKVLKGMIDTINNVLQSDDTSLDELQELVNYVKSNKGLIDDITINKVNVADIIDNLISSISDQPLSANQGKVLKDALDALTAVVSTKAVAADTYTKSEVNAKETALYTAIGDEETRALAAESSLANDISDLDEAKLDVSVFNTEKSTINTSISTEASTARAAEEALDDKIDAEILRADTEEQRLAGLISSEATRADTEEQRLAGLISSEASTARSAESGLTTRINNLDLSTVGQAGKYIKTVGQTDGQLSATSESFDTDFTDATNNTAPTTSAVKTYVDAETARAEAQEALKVNYTDVVDNLTSTSTTHPLSAKQGKVLKELIDTINGVLSTQEEDLDTIQEIVTYIKNNKSTIDEILTDKVNISDIVDNLTSEDVDDQPLSANQGFVLKGLLDALTDVVATKAVASNVYTKSEIDDKEDALEALVSSEETRASTAETALGARIDALDLSEVGENGYYIKKVSQLNGQVSAVKQGFDVTLNGATDNNVPSSKTVKDYVDAETTRASAAEASLGTRIDNLDLSTVGETGSYLKTISQSNGQVSASSQAFDTEIDENSSDNNVPSSEAVKEYVDSSVSSEASIARAAESALDTKINALDLTEVGSNGGYIKTVSQLNGQVSAARQAFDTAINSNSNNNNAPTSKAAKDYTDAETSRATGVEALKINYTDIVDDLVTEDSSKPLSANQGKELKDALDDLTDVVATKAVDANVYHKTDIDSKETAIKALITAEANRASGEEEDLADAIEAEETRATTEEAKKINYTDIVDNLTTDNSNKPLSAKQGKTLKTLIDNINSLLASNDVDLDTLQEVVTYIKNNKNLIDSITTDKVNVSDIVDALTSSSANKPLSANQGKVLKGLIDSLTTTVGTKAADADVYHKTYIDDLESEIKGLITAEESRASDEEDDLADAISAEATTRATEDAKKVNITDIVDVLTSASTNKPLSANQGKVLKGLIDTINSTLASNDTSLDTIQEIVTYIKANRTDIDSILSGKVNVSDIIDDLTHSDSNKPLSAKQGKALKGLITTLEGVVATKAVAADTYTKTEVDALDDAIEALVSAEESRASGVEAGLQSSKQDVISATNKISSDFVDDTSKTHKFVTSSQITDIADNKTARHTHSNKSLLDTYTQTEVNLADAVSKKHSHSNKAVLDDIESAFTSADRTKFTGIASGAQVNVIETVKVNNTALTVTSKAVNIDLSAYALKSYADATAHTISITPKGNFSYDFQLLDKSGNKLGSAVNVDLPIESLVTTGSYDSVNKKIVLTLQDDSTIDIPVADLIAGLVTESDLNTLIAGYYTKSQIDTSLAGKQAKIDSSHKLDADLVDDSNATHKFATSSELSQIASNTSARHSHSNKTILDNTTASYTSAEQTKLSGIATGAQVNVLEGVQLNGTNLTISSKKVNVDLTGSYYNKTQVDTALATKANIIEIVDLTSL